MAAVQRGDAEAYGALLDDIGPMMKYLRRRVWDTEEAHDVNQETFLALQRGRHTYPPARLLEPWFFAIARRVCTEHQRRRLTRHPTELLVDALPEGNACRRISGACPSYSGTLRKHVK